MKRFSISNLTTPVLWLTVMNESLRKLDTAHGDVRVEDVYKSSDILERIAGNGLI